MARKALSIFLVIRNDDVDYEENEAVVVIAANSDDAREMAASAHGSHPAGAWHLPSTTVELVGKARPEDVGHVVLAANRGA